MKRTTQILAGAAALSLTLVGCGGDDASEPTTGTDGEQATSADPISEPAEPITLTFQSLSDQPQAIAATEAAVEAWNAEHPNITVEIVPAGWDGIYDKLITQFNGDAAPDIIHYEAASIVPFARDGYLADLTDLMSDERRADIPEGILEAVTVDDQVVAYPTELQSYMVFANTALLEQAGVEIPTGETMTWDQLREMAEQVTDGSVYGLGWGLASPTATFMTMAPEFGGEFFDSAGRDAQLTIGEGELAIPQLIHDMAYEDQSILPVTLTLSGGKTLPYFYDGQVAMTVQGSYQAANIANDAPEGFEWTVLPPLEGPEGAGQAANPQTLSVNIDSEHVEYAAQFIEFFTEAENLAALNKADALIPATKSAQELLATEMADQTGWDQILASGQHMTGAPYLFVDAYAQWKDTVATPAFQRYLAQEIDYDGLKSELESGWESLQR